MKTLKILLMPAIIFCIVTGSCTKDVKDQPSQVNDRDQPDSSGAAQMIVSSWFSATWQYEATDSNGGQIHVFHRSVPELNGEFLKTGQLLIFGKGGYEMREPTVLPANFDNNKISAKVIGDDLKFILINSGGQISSSLQFRYIFIPVDQLFPGGFDYDNYSALCMYYHIYE